MKTLKLKGKYQQTGILAKVCLFLFLMLLLTLLGMGLWAITTSGSQTTASLKWLQLLQTVCTFLLPCLCCAYLWSEQPLEWLHLRQGISWQAAVIVVFLMLLASPAINLLGYWNEQMTLPAFLQPLEDLMKQQEETAAQLTERFIKADNVGFLLWNIILMALLPALSEEVCFRGVLQNLFNRTKPSQTISNNFKQIQTPPNTPHLAIWVSAILFSAIHFQFYGFIPRMLMGALFGYMLAWSGSLWLPILAHFTNNCAAVLLYNFYYMRHLPTDDIAAFGTGTTQWVGYLSMALTILMIYLLRKFLTKLSARRRVSCRFDLS